DVMQASAAQTPRIGPEGASFNLTPGVADNLGRAALHGVVALEYRQDGNWRSAGFEIAAQPASSPPAGMDERPAQFSDDYPLAELERAGGGAQTAPAALDMAGLFAAAVLAFLGGLILNIMPCVLPVLA